MKTAIITSESDSVQNVLHSWYVANPDKIVVNVSTFYDRISENHKAIISYYE